MMAKWSKMKQKAAHRRTANHLHDNGCCATHELACARSHRFCWFFVFLCCWFYFVWHNIDIANVVLWIPLFFPAFFFSSYFCLLLFINKCYVVFFFSLSLSLTLSVLKRVSIEFAQYVISRDSWTTIYGLLSNVSHIALWLAAVLAHSLASSVKTFFEVNWVNSMIVIIITVISCHNSHSKMIIKHAHFTVAQQNQSIPDH